MVRKEESGGSKKKQRPDLEPDTMELEKKREKDSFLNLREGAFVQDTEGLNHTHSVFDKTAVFHVGSRGE